MAGVGMVASPTRYSVYVGNIPYQTTEDAIGNHFSQAGRVTNVRIVYDRETGRPKGFGFCEFSDEAGAQNAVNTLNGTDFNGRSLRIVHDSSALSKEGLKSIVSESADMVFLGEIKCNEWPVDLESAFKGYHKTLVTSKERKGGYAGVALLSKIEPLKVWKGIGDNLFDNEGRLIVAEFNHFYFIGAYVPNSGRGLVNLQKRGKWEELFLDKIKSLDEKKPVIYTGDLNVAHNEIDLANPESNRNKTAGFTDQERGWFTRLLSAGFKDTYREIHPEKREYTFWTYTGNARAKNVKSSEIRGDVNGSDHVPVVLEISV
uniref:exodeoxyribonuclease III n=1 Tax=Angiostrongylus cantonensis TaxID=6313 RepID=A0A0K0D0A9_ANGCA